jgi:hypothetical protein
MPGLAGVPGNGPLGSARSRGGGRGRYRAAYRMLEKRIGLFTSLRIAELDRLALKRKVDEIGKLDRD